MFRFLKASALILLFCGSTLADDRFLDAGAPAADREWRAADYKTVVQILSEKKAPLPRLEETDGKKVLQRFCSIENLTFGRNRTLPLSSRMEDFFGLQQSANQVTKLYVAEAVGGAKVAGEMSLLLGFMLHVSALGIDLVGEFLPTIPKDSRYQARMDALAQMRSGLATIFTGAYSSIADDQIYTDDQRSSMLAAVAATADQFSSVLGADTKVEMISKFSKLQGRFTSPNDLKYIETITKMLGR